MEAVVMSPPAIEARQLGQVGFTRLYLRAGRKGVRNHARNLLRLIGVLFCIALLGPQAAGCSVCVSKPLKFAFQDSKLFFVGKVKQQQQWRVTFHVLEQFAGDKASEVTLDTSNSCSMSNFSVGMSYLVEATETEHGLHAYLCSHTQAVEKAARELQVVRRRSTWWRCPLSRVSLYRLRHHLGRRFGG